jgi:membrane associated rhomboid family serine protease
MLSITTLLLTSTLLISYACLQNPTLMAKLQHHPYEEYRTGEYHRWLTAGFVHADYLHLLFNLMALYFFAADQGGHPGLETWFARRFPASGPTLFLVFYLLSVVAASSATYYRHRHTPAFASVGASGAVSAVLFAAVLIDPNQQIFLYFIPVGIPGYLFCGLYLWYSSYAARHRNDSIDHLAHFFGAIFGLLFLLLLEPSLATALPGKIGGPAFYPGR